jgi:hypothetical protein
MIEFVDMAFTAYMRTVLPSPYTVVWAPIENSQGAISRAAQKALADFQEAHPDTKVTRPQLTRGYPGICTFRTKTEKNSIASTPKAFRGWPIGQFPDNEQQVSIKGMVSPGDVISISLTSTDIEGGSTSVSYTVQANDNCGDIATGLANAINNSSPLQAANITAVAFQYSIGVFRDPASTNTLTLADISDDSVTEKLTIESDLAGDHSRILAAHTRVTYTVQAWAKFWSDLNAIERSLAFADVYQAIHTDIQGNPMDWYLEGTNVTYTHQINETLDKEKWFGFTKDFYVDSLWAHSKRVPPINNIVVNYEEIINGSPVLLDTIDIVFGKENNEIFIP